MSKHTRTTKGKRVVVTLIDGTVLTDRFICRPNSRRWIELEQHGKITMAIVKSMADLKGPLDKRRIEPPENA